MKIPATDLEVLQSAFAYLHDAVGNIQCLYTFIKNHTTHKDIEYTLYIHSIHKAKQIESIMGRVVDYPVFGKEIDMGNRTILYGIIKNSLGVDRIGYLDSFGDCTGTCVDENLQLYEIVI